MNKEELLEKLSITISKGDSEASASVAHEIMDAGIDPLEAILKGATRGLDIVGEKFERLEAFLPDLMLAGDAMKACVAIFREKLPASDLSKAGLGKIVIGTVFGDISQQQAMGVPLEDALRQAAARSYSEDMRLFATAVSIQLRTGGNLADMMSRLAAVIRDRMRLSQRVRVLTAQTQLSKRILLALPIGVFFLINMLNPQYMSLLYRTDLGRTLLAAAAVGMLVGAYVMNRMARIRA